MPETVVVAEVSIEASNVGDEVLVLLLCDTDCKCSILELIKVLALEVALEEQEERNLLVAKLVKNDKTSCP